jgi:hypothetical protein
VNRRPRLELRGSSASPEEAAAVIAAVEQFLRDTAPPPAEERDRTVVSPWVRTARLEGVERDPGFQPW